MHQSLVGALNKELMHSGCCAFHMPVYKTEKKSISIKMKVKCQLLLNINLHHESIYWWNTSFVIKKECREICEEDGEVEVKDLLRKMNAIMKWGWDGWSGIITSSATLCWCTSDKIIGKWLQLKIMQFIFCCCGTLQGPKWSMSSIRPLKKQTNSPAKTCHL